MEFQPQNPINVANFIIELAKKNKKNVTNLQLQKILFFLQGYSLSHFRTPLIDGKFSKWKYGPVQQEVYHLFRSYGSSPIVDEAIDAFYDHGKLVIQPYSKVDEKSIGNEEIFNQISNFAYKLLNKSAWELVNMTHSHSSWSKNYESIINHCAEDYKQEEILNCYESNKGSLND